MPKEEPVVPEELGVAQTQGATRLKRLAPPVLLAVCILIPIGWFYVPLRQEAHYREQVERAHNYLRGIGPPPDDGYIFPAGNEPFDAKLAAETYREQQKELEARRAAGELVPSAAHNHFIVDNATIPITEIRKGGPPRDGIPSIDDPRFVSAENARWLRDSDRVIGLDINGVARAYPQRILNIHELVNDVIGGEPVLVSFCPLCGTSMVFERTVNDDVLEFGVSGLLYNSDVLMYDRTSDSLWSQVKMEAIAGHRVGDKLTLLSAAQTTWGAWREAHPTSEVLDFDGDDRRRYMVNPYERYMKSDNTMFPVPFHRNELRKKDWIAGIIVNGKAVAYPLARLSDGEFDDQVAGSDIVVSFDAASEWMRVRLSDSGEAVPVTRAYWFAWQAFHPDTEVRD